MSKLLVVDDEYRIRQIIKKYAEFEGYEVEEAVDGMQAIELCRRQDFDLIIMDVMMPELDGFEIGSDDYVVKPFSPKELMMRVNAVIKRSGKANSEPEKDIFTYKGLSVDFSARIVTIDGERVEMTPKEYELFFYMVKNKGIAVKS